MGILLNKAKNVVINGAMDFWQRGTSFAAAANQAYVADRYQYNKNGTMVHTVSSSTDVPNLAESGFTFNSSLLATLTTPQASFAAGNFLAISQKVEGYFISGLLSKNITVSFWVKSTLPGTFAFALRNSGTTRSYVKSFSVSNANTWEKKVIALTHDNTGSWNVTTGIGFFLSWVTACGSTYLAADSTWNNGNFFGVTGMSNGVAAGFTEFRITGVQLEEGVSDSNFERAGGDIVSDSGLCQRYYERLAVANGNSFMSGYSPSTTTFQAAGRVFRPKRVDTVMNISPSVTDGRTYGAGSISTPNTIVSLPTRTCFASGVVLVAGTSTTAMGDFETISFVPYTNGAGYIEADAEL